MSFSIFTELTKLNRGGRLDSFIVLLTGGTLAFFGLGGIMNYLSGSGMMSLADPVFGISFQTVILILSGVELVLAFVFLFARRQTIALVLIGWMVMVVGIYRIGVESVGWQHLNALTLQWQTIFKLSFKTTDEITIAILSFLAVGSLICLTVKFMPAPSQIKTFCPSCGGHIRFAVKNLGQQTACPHCKKALTLRQPDAKLKTSCFFCQGHIEFPAHAIGEKMPCPHCKMDITLKEPV